MKEHRDLYSHPDQTARGTAYNRTQTEEERAASLELQRALMAGEPLIPPPPPTEPHELEDDPLWTEFLVASLPEYSESGSELYDVEAMTGAAWDIMLALDEARRGA